MSYTKGRPLCPEEKKLLVSVKHYFDRNKSEFRSSESGVQMTADALGIGLATVNRVMASYHKDPDSIKASPQLRGRQLIQLICHIKKQFDPIFAKPIWRGVILV